MTLGSDTSKYVSRCMKENVGEVTGLMQASERFRAAQEVEHLRNEALQNVTAFRFSLVKTGQVPLSTIVQIGKIAKALGRASSVKELVSLIEEFRKVAGPYQKENSLPWRDTMNGTVQVMSRVCPPLGMNDE